MDLGWSAPIQVTVCTIDSCYSLNRGTRHLERSFHLSNTQGGLSPPRQERIFTSHFPGGLSPPREDYHLSPCRFRIVTPICRDKGQTIRKVVVGGLKKKNRGRFYYINDCFAKEQTETMRVQKQFFKITVAWNLIFGYEISIGNFHM